jgi:hypothetical protein
VVLVADGWLRFRAPRRAAQQLLALRLRLAEAFASRVRHPRHELPQALRGEQAPPGDPFWCAAGCGPQGGIASLTGAVPAEDGGGRQRPLRSKYGHAAT